VRKVGREINTDYAQLRDRYETPKYPLVLAHGLFGFAELRLAGSFLPGIAYWRGIKDALVQNALTNRPHLSKDHHHHHHPPAVIACTVPPSGSIASRAKHLAADISRQLALKEDDDGTTGTTTVNIIAHSMGGLDARYLISRLKPPHLKVASLTTIATPHRGSCIADLLLDPSSSHQHPLQNNKDHHHHPSPARVNAFISRALGAAGLEADAFVQLSRPYLMDHFNPTVPDDPATRYFSFGASMVPTKGDTDDDNMVTPAILSPFRLTWGELRREEGPNDGLVSVGSARWGEDRGTLVGVSHLDLINWTNRIGWTVKEWLGVKRKCV
jgi:triacylglycerol lipase